MSHHSGDRLRIAWLVVIPFLLAQLCLAGCHQGRQASEEARLVGSGAAPGPGSDRSSAPARGPASGPASARAVAAADQPSRSLGEGSSESADAAPSGATQTPAIPPPDPGAEAIIAALRDAIDRATPDAGAPALIRFGPIRNQSRADSSAFDAMLLELRSLLERPAQAGGLTLDAAPAGQPDFELHGFVYLLRVGALDTWETYFLLRRADDRSLVWQSTRPARMACEARPGEPRIIFPAGSPVSE